MCWERDHDWVLERTRHHHELLTVILPPELAGPAGLKALRALRPELQNTPPTEIRSRIDARGRIELGTFDSTEAHRIVEQATTLGLGVERVDRSFVSYLPMDRTTQSALLIEDDAEAERIAREMIAAGVPVVEVEA